MGSFELNQNNLGDAETLLELAKTQQIKVYHGKHLDIAQSCKTLGRLYLKKGDLSQAEQNFRGALSHVASRVVMSTPVTLASFGKSSRFYLIFMS